MSGPHRNGSATSTATALANAWSQPQPDKTWTPPAVMPPSLQGNAMSCCYGCPGADKPACCAHMEWRKARLSYLRTEGVPYHEMLITGIKGRRRRWLIEQLARTIFRGDVHKDA